MRHKRSSMRFSLGDSLQNCVITGDTAFIAENKGLQSLSTKSQLLLTSCLSIFRSKAFTDKGFEVTVTTTGTDKGDIG